MNEHEMLTRTGQDSARGAWGTHKLFRLDAAGQVLAAVDVPAGLGWSLDPDLAGAPEEKQLPRDLVLHEGALVLPAIGLSAELATTIYRIKLP